MRKHILIMAMAAMSLSVFQSCDKETEVVTFVEDFPVFVDPEGAPLNGSEVYLKLGESYDYSYSATLNGVDCTKQTTMSIVDMNGEPATEIDNSKPGLYHIYYTGKTSSGLTSWRSERTVFVYDPQVELSIAGTYTVDMQDSYRVYDGKTIKFADEAGGRGFGGSTIVTVKKLCPGFFSISDLFAGWYDQLRGLNATKPGQAIMSAYICLNADNTISMLSNGQCSYFGISTVDKFDDAVFDPATGKVSYHTLIWDMDFYVYMNNNDFPDTSFIDEPDSEDE